MRKVRRPIKLSERKKNRQAELDKHAEQKTEDLKDIRLSTDIDKNIDQIRSILGDSDDLVIRNFVIAGDLEKKAAIVFIDGLINSTIIDDYILSSLMFQTRQPPYVPAKTAGTKAGDTKTDGSNAGAEEKSAKGIKTGGMKHSAKEKAPTMEPAAVKAKLNASKEKSDAPQEKSSPEPEESGTTAELAQRLTQTGLTINEVGQANDFRQVIRSILSGDTVLLVDGETMALFMNTKGWERRSVQEPNTEAVIRGPRDGFTETLRVNTALIRLRLKDPKLRVKNMTVGKRTNTDIALIYIDDIVHPKVLEEVIKRIEAINIDGALESGYLEQFIEDNHYSPFPQIQNTERPDKAVANLLEGKVVIVTDGTPFVLIAPAVFSQFYQSPEDYYERFGIATFIRFIRLLSMALALFLPSLYIAFVAFHPEMLPSDMAIAIMAGRSAVPFPALIEAFVIEIAVEILREASVRLPGPIGPTIGIVGALIIGESAVSAGLVSPILVIIVGLTTVGSFASPSYSAAIALRMLRFPMMIAAGTFGLMGIMLLLFVIVVHLSSLKSFGVPYMAPLSPSRLSDLKDTWIRAPLFFMRRRPKIFKPQDDQRIG